MGEYHVVKDGGATHEKVGLYKRVESIPAVSGGIKWCCAGAGRVPEDWDLGNFLCLRQVTPGRSCHRIHDAIGAAIDVHANTGESIRIAHRRAGERRRNRGHGVGCWLMRMKKDTVIRRSWIAAAGRGDHVVRLYKNV